MRVCVCIYGYVYVYTGCLIDGQGLSGLYRAKEVRLDCRGTRGEIEEMMRPIISTELYTLSLSFPFCFAPSCAIQLFTSCRCVGDLIDLMVPFQIPGSQAVLPFLFSSSFIRLE